MILMRITKRSMRRQMMKSVTIILLGATGDLAKKKLLPALRQLVQKERLSRIDVVAIGRKEFTGASYADYVGVGERTGPGEKGRDLADHKLKIHYFKADFSKKDSLKGMLPLLESIEDKDCLGRLFYLATSPEHFKTVAHQIHLYCQKKEGFNRIMIEKPFGYDLKSSKELNKSLREYFEEEQLFRVDHYLAKDTIQNLLVLRFSNPFFERTWNSKFIERIRITVSEDMGVGERLGYYDGSGAIRDMIQNHLMQIASFILMDMPMSTMAEHIHEAKANAIRRLRFGGQVTIGQYEGYQQELKDAELKPSNTETYARLRLLSSDPRWRGTEIILETGKELSKRFARIDLVYKREPCAIYCDINTNPNKLMLCIQPNQKITMHMNTRVPGKDLDIKHVNLEFFPEKVFSSNTPESYEIILEDCIKGDRTLFISEPELEASWKLTDLIRARIRGKKPMTYKKKSINLDVDG
jgi:glucose-6-phosphate 1-dehydrogenase